MPLAILILLSTWLYEAGGYAKEIATTIAISRTPYAFKFLWSPIIDRLEIPFLYKIGRRKSWMLLTVTINVVIVFLFSQIIPKDNFNTIYYLAFILGASSASYDIAFDAFRIDSLSTEKQGYGVSCAIFGYRIGMLIVSSGALYMAQDYGWSSSFIMLGAVLALGFVYLPLLIEPKHASREHMSLEEKIQDSVVNPFLDFFKRNYSIIILLAVVLYKLGDVLLAGVANIYYLELGYEKKTIAQIAKFYGFGATMLGVYLGAYATDKLGHLRGLVVCGVLQALVNAIYIWLHYAPVTSNSLLIAITIENIGAGAGTVALTAYLSALCNKNYSATQYALFSSLSAFLNSTISTKAGLMVKEFGWDYFFGLTVILSFPALVIFLYLARKEVRV